MKEEQKIKKTPKMYIKKTDNWYRLYSWINGKKIYFHAGTYHDCINQKHTIEHGERFD